MSISNPVAVDISKNTLEVKNRFFACVVPNDEKGIKKLLDKIKPLQCPLIVCEATGGYERLLIKTMHIKKITVCHANPGRVRSFARF